MYTSRYSGADGSGMGSNVWKCSPYLAPDESSDGVTALLVAIGAMRPVLSTLASAARREQSAGSVWPDTMLDRDMSNVSV